jgi:hypothetical protein
MSPSRSGSKRRSRFVRVWSSVAAGAMAAAAVLAAGPSARVSAAAGCVAADMYAHHTTVPTDATGGASVAGAKFGAAVVSGDFNKDGKADVAVGAPNDKVGGVASGTVSVFPGSATGIGTGKRLTQADVGAGNEAGDLWGASLAAGDFNKDGFTDLAVGSPGEVVGTATKAGAVSVFRGSASGLTAGAWYDQSTGGGASEASDAFGSSLAAGDFNGDGFADLAIGTPGEIPAPETTRGGGVFVYKGSASLLVLGWNLRQESFGGNTEAGDQFGAAVAAGNVTGSTHVDLVVGAPGEAPGSDPAGAGQIFVSPGSASGPSTGFGRLQTNAAGANEANDHFGATLAVGNFDKDALADIAAGVPGEAPETNPAGGSIAIFPGASSQTATGFWVQESQAGEAIVAGDKFGSSLATGDANGDGYADLLTGAPGKTYGSATAAGAGYLYSGGPRDAGSTVSVKIGRRIAQPDVQESNETNDAFGSALAFGDTTGDGKSEAVIGASGEAPTGQPASGAAVQLTKLAPPAPPSVPTEQFTATAAVQASPQGTAAATLEYAYSDNIGRLVHGHQTDPDDPRTLHWTVISGLEAYAGKPSLAEQADGKLQVAVHNTSSNVWVNTQATKNPAAWGSWVNTGGLMASHTAIAKQTDGTLALFAVDGNGVLWVLQQPAQNATHTAWMSTGVTGLTGAPAAVTLSNGIKVFARDTSGDIKTALYANRTLSGCASLNGSGLTGTPAGVGLPGGRIRVFARAADGSIQTQQNDSSGVFGGTWDTVTGLTAAGSPSALISPASGKVEVVARDSAGILWSTGETVQGSGQWRDWVKVQRDDDAYLAATDPTAFSYSGEGGPTWALVVRDVDNVSRLYFPTDATALVADESEPLRFVPHTLPAPPRQPSR